MPIKIILKLVHKDLKIKKVKKNLVVTLVVVSYSNREYSIETSKRCNTLIFTFMRHNHALCLLWRL